MFPVLGFSGQEYWRGWPCPPPGVSSQPRIKPRSPTLQTDSFTIWATPAKLSTKCRGRAKTLSEKQKSRRVIITGNSRIPRNPGACVQQSERVNQKKKKFPGKEWVEHKNTNGVHTEHCTAGPWSSCPNGSRRGEHCREKSPVTAQSCPTPCDPTDHTHQAPCPWDSPGKNAGVGFHFLLQGIFLTKGSNPGLAHSRQTHYLISVALPH